VKEKNNYQQGFRFKGVDRILLLQRPRQGRGLSQRKGAHFDFKRLKNGRGEWLLKGHQST